MNEAVVLLLFITSVNAGNNYEDCQTRFLSKPTTPSRLILNVSTLANSIISRLSHNSTLMARETLSQYPEIRGLILTSPKEQILAFNITRRLRIFPNRTTDTEMFWLSLENTKNGWSPAFKVCHFLKGDWFYGFVVRKGNSTVELFLDLNLNQCDEELVEIFQEPQKCDLDTTYVSSFINYLLN